MASAAALADAARLPASPGAYVLAIELRRTLSFATAVTGPVRLPPGRYAYCGSARGPGGLGARIRRHLRRDTRIHWHVDRLTTAGEIVAVVARPGGDECALLRDLLARPGVTVPVLRLGATDCRRCPAHLVAVPADFDPAVFL
ncbi:MAG: GIY-YIG nuclease family protein [Alphaproteobacteria bacterium]|nr:GIY-YIG nuclease family protein [Alphaproteobacteria bacterium]